jgi:hypothetical protein
MKSTVADTGRASIRGARSLRSSAACLRLMLIAALMAFAAKAQAFIDPVVIVPARPVAGQPVAFSVRIGVCEYLQAFGPSNGTTLFATDEWRSIVVSGNTLRVTVRALYAPDQSACVYPTGNFQFSLGSLPMGSYRLELYGEEIFNPTFRPLIGSAQFVVGAPPTPVPAVRWPVLMILIVAAGAAGVARLRTP